MTSFYVLFLWMEKKKKEKGCGRKKSTNAISQKRHSFEWTELLLPRGLMFFSSGAKRNTSASLKAPTALQMLRMIDTQAGVFIRLVLATVANVFCCGNNAYHETRRKHAGVTSVENEPKAF